jgi:hypothetical protein
MPVSHRKPKGVGFASQRGGVERVHLKPSEQWRRVLRGLRAPMADRDPPRPVERRRHIPAALHEVQGCSIQMNAGVVRHETDRL